MHEPQVSVPFPAHGAKLSNSATHGKHYRIERLTNSLQTRIARQRVLYFNENLFLWFPNCWQSLSFAGAIRL